MAAGSIVLLKVFLPMELTFDERNALYRQGLKSAARLGDGKIPIRHGVKIVLYDEINRPIGSGEIILAVDETEAAL